MQVRLLGPVDVTVDGVARPIPGLRRKAVLAMLALTPGEIVSTDRLIDVVWSDRPSSAAPNSLPAHVSYLRGALGARTAIVARPPGYVLDIGAEATDLQVAERLIRQGRQSTDPGQSASLLRAALARWRGRPLVDVAGLPWLAEQAERLTVIHLEAVEALVDARLALGEHAQLLAELDGLIGQYPFREHVHGQLMVALYRAGRQADALAAYQRLRRNLRDELGIEPGPALRDLEAAILRQDAALHPHSTVTAAPRPPADSAVAPVPAQLPATVDGFVGREAQLDQLDAFLATSRDGGSPTLIIAAIGGTAGVGKTSLAVHWGRRVRDHFPDGQLYLNLRGYATRPPVQPGQALAQFLHGLGVPAERVPADVDEAAAMYRTLLADRRILIILDNAASPEQVRPLLPGSPHCVVLVTSRDRLGGLVVSEGARLLTLDVLPPDEAHALLSGILGPERVQAEPQAASDLARMCGFLPLALRIAAANLVMRPGASIAQHVADLRGDNRLAALRIDGDEQSAVRAAFDLSYATLKPDERRLFRLLGLIPGVDVDGAAAAAIAGTSMGQIRRILGRLVDGHLVDESATGRFTLHDLLRLYARSLADAEDGPREITAAKERLCAFYLTGTETAADLLYPETIRLPARPTLPGPRTGPAFADHEQALAWLDAERTNLVALINETTEHGPRPTAWHLADNLRGYFYLRRHAGDWLAVATDALRAAGRQPGPMAAAHLSRGVAFNMQGRSDPAIDDFTAALSLAEQAGWLEGQAAALNNLGTVYSHTGRHRQAAEHYTQTVAVHERTGRLVGQAVALDNLGVVRRELGELESAAGLHLKAIALYRQAGLPFSHATALANLAGVHHDLGLLDDALDRYTQALAMHRQTGNRDREAICLLGIANAHRAAGRHHQALRPAEDAFELAREIGDRRTEAFAAMTLGTIDDSLGRHQSGLGHHRHAQRLAGATGSRYIQAKALVGVAGAQVRLDRADEALATVLVALAIIRSNGYRALEVDALTVLAEIHTVRGRPDEATISARNALTLGEQIGYDPGRPRQPRNRRVALRRTEVVQAARG